ncbi:MAG: NUDIX hydrolase [Cyanobacteria bacterium]|nr:NUDIX hydrolase [Cyanobacteriota bacterium]
MGKKARIRPIAICLFRRGEEPRPDPKGDRILVHEGEDTVAGFRFGRPLGGGIDFGESSQAAVVREIREELGAEITAVRLLGIVESIYIYEGAPGHEIVFVYDAQFVDETLYAQESLRVTEGERVFTARWRSLDELRGDPLVLVPKGLWQYL